MSRFPYAEAVCQVSRPLDWTDDKVDLMVKACRELAVFHYESSPDIKALYDRHGFDPRSIETEFDLARIPPLGVAAMKSYLFTSLPHEQTVLRLTSSGTRGQKTQIWFDEASLARCQRMLDVYLEQEGMISDKETNYLVFTYDPDDAGDLGIAYTEKNQLRFAPAAKVFYAVKKGADGQWKFLKEEALRVLEDYEAEGKPVRIMGMPAFLFEFTELAGARRFSLPAGSLMITGGGWKAAEDKKVTREAFRQRCSEVFGIPDEWVRDAYGMAEHCAPYFECKHHRFHVAVFNRLIIRDPVTMEALPPGERGLLELITPFNAMMPNLAILATDWARLHADPCPCGWASPTFEILGRAGTSKHKGCAIHADDIVKRG